MRKQPRTEAQRAAARANGAKSKGAITPHGKLKSAANSLKHGLMAKAILLPHESRENFLEVCNKLNDDYLPRTATEEILVHRMVLAQWRLTRLWNYERVSMLLEATSAIVPEIITDEGVWYEPSARDTVAFHALHGRARSGSVLQISEMRFLRQFAQALGLLQKGRALLAHEQYKIKETNPPISDKC
jgi:hypothetical protein